MKLSNRSKFILLLLIILLNLILRFQFEYREIGYDSFEMHIMTNSLTEFGYAKWFLHPLSIVGMYPASYTSAMHFLLSGISQTTGLGMYQIIIVYTIFLGFFSIFITYILAGAFFNNDVYKFLAAFSFSTLPAVLNYTTMTIPTRGLFVIIAPIILYLLLKLLENFRIKYLFLLILISLFLFSTHHLFYLLLPTYGSFVIIALFFKTKLRYFITLKDKIFSRFNNRIFSNYFTPFSILAGFALMYSIPFITKRFLETSRYDPIYISYIRYIGLLSILAVGGLLYLIFKNNRNSKEWFLILSTIFITVFIYQVTYMKWFLPILVILFISLGLFNISRNYPQKKKSLHVLSIILLLSLTISGYFQFLHDYNIPERGVNDSTYKTGEWIKNNVEGNCISPDEINGRRVSSVSETTHFVDTSDRVDLIYGFVNINISDYEQYPITSDDFWLSGYKDRAVGSRLWEGINMLWESPYDHNISYVVENTRTNGKLRWTHKGKTAELLQLVYGESNCLYDVGRLKVWEL